jgi:hypothetical protein
MPQSPFDSLKKATSIGPTIPGSDVPLDDRGSPLTATSIPELLARYGLDPTNPGNWNIPNAASVIGGGEDLVKALGPLFSGGLERGSELAKELAGRALQAPEAPMKSRAANAFVTQLGRKIPPVDPNKIAATEKVTSFLIPETSNPVVPKIPANLKNFNWRKVVTPNSSRPAKIVGLEFPEQMTPMARDAEIAAKRSSQQDYLKTNATPLSARNTPANVFNTRRAGYWNELREHIKTLPDTMTAKDILGSKNIPSKYAVNNNDVLTEKIRGILDLLGRTK